MIISDLIKILKNYPENSVVLINNKEIFAVNSNKQNINISSIEENSLVEKLVINTNN